ncbi:phage head-tail connector protein [Lagierella massiliensis]|uniref:phage head-tail connector protein n=1 Tax=Lagierella massiliensis TaxID=1689303 RepID=UPI0006D814BF|nr:phage head-tail connector protein [Lagierella massiliensis]
MDILGRAEALIFINKGQSEEEKALLSAIGDLITDKVMRRITKYIPDTKEIPKVLEYAIVEAIISRYNRIGTEGMSTEMVEGHSMTFEKNDKAMEDLMAEVDDWIDDNLEDSTIKKVVRFL